MDRVLKDEDRNVGFRIVIDTREQEPYGFACPTVRQKLDAGDYSVAGHEDAVAVERKTLADFTSTVIHESDRFAAELDRLAGYSAACVVVEADLDAVLRGREERQLRGASPASLLGAAAHIAVSCGIPVFWCGSRQAACAFTEQYLRAFVRRVAREAGQFFRGRAHYPGGGSHG